MKSQSICLWVCRVFTAVCGRSPVGVSRGCSPVAVLGLLTEEAALTAEGRLPSAWASVVAAFGLGSCGLWARQLWCSGLVARGQVGSFWNRDQTRVPCTGRWILNHWATREAAGFFVMNKA